MYEQWIKNKDQPTVMYCWVGPAREEGIIGVRINVWYSYVVLPRE